MDKLKLHIISLFAFLFSNVLLGQIILEEEHFHFGNQEIVYINNDDVRLVYEIKSAIHNNMRLLINELDQQSKPNKFVPSDIDIPFINTTFYVDNRNGDLFDLVVITRFDDIQVIATIKDFKSDPNLINEYYLKRFSNFYSVLNGLIIIHGNPCDVYCIETNSKFTFSNDFNNKMYFESPSFTLMNYEVKLGDKLQDELRLKHSESYKFWAQKDALSRRLGAAGTTLREDEGSRLLYRDLDWIIEANNSDPFNSNIVGIIESKVNSSKLHLIKGYNDDKTCRLELHIPAKLHREFFKDSTNVNTGAVLSLNMSGVWKKYDLSPIFGISSNGDIVITLYSGPISQILPLFQCDRVAIGLNSSDGKTLTILNEYARSNLLPLFFNERLYKYLDGTAIYKSNGELEQGRPYYPFTNPSRTELSNRLNGTNSMSVSGNPNTFVNTGTSNGDYSLGSRKALSRPKPAYGCEGDGVVVVRIWVDRAGVVQRVAVASGTTTTEPCLLNSAEEAARKTRWEGDAAATDLQVGTIRYRFSQQ